MKKIFTCFLSISLLFFFKYTFAQTVYVSHSWDGSFKGEHWVNITTGSNGTGTEIWKQNNNACSSSRGGQITDIAVDLSAYCGQTLYLNMYDYYDDTWDGSSYQIEETASGPVIISGNDPDDTNDNGSGCTTNMIEHSHSFSVACPGPSVSVSPASLTNLDYCFGGGPSASQTFTVSGTSLTADITITAPTNFEVSTDNTTFGTSVTLTQSGGSVTSTTIYAQLKSGLVVATYGPSNATAASTGATTQNVALSGDVTAKPYYCRSGNQHLYDYWKPY